MALLGKQIKTLNSKAEQTPDLVKNIIIDDFFSAALRRRVKIEVMLPPWYNEVPNYHFPVLYLNDGQTLRHVRIYETLMDAYSRNLIPPIIIVGIHAANRMQEYGVAGVPDFKKRGAKADKYTRFITHELRNLINANFRTLNHAKFNMIAGYSLGGLSAFDIAFHHPESFSCAGVFSGSFWWRSKAYNDGYNEATDRIMHQVIRQATVTPPVRFWFQCGTHDEIADRNANDVIDAIDDTLDIIQDLKHLGFSAGDEVQYVEVVNGFHNEATWADVMPLFLTWAFNGEEGNVHSAAPTS